MIIKNLAMGVVVTPPSTPTAGTTATLRAGEGAYFGTSFPFLATTAPPDQLSNPNYAEIILVTGKSTDTLTFVRAKRGTTAKSIAANWIIANGIYVEDVNGVAVTVATAAATATKVGTTTDADYTPALGDKLLVTFSNGMNVASPTLNIDGSGAKAINVGNTAVTTALFNTTSAVTVPMWYDGTAYQLYGSYTGLGSNGFIPDQTPTGTVDGTNKVFTTAAAYVPGSLKVFINGWKQKTTTHFVETTPASGVFTMDEAPLTGDLITVEYQIVVTTTGNADTVDGIHANATPTANQLLPLNSNSQLPGTSLGTVRLNAIENTNFANGIALTANTWTDLKANQSFTVGSSSSIVLISISTATLVGNASLASGTSSRLVIDSGGTPQIFGLGGNNVQTPTGGYANPFSGAGIVMVTGLSAGTHTVKTQILTNVSGNSAYCRPVSNPDAEFYTTRVLEIGG